MTTNELPDIYPMGHTSWSWRCRRDGCDYRALTIDAPRERAEAARDRHEATHDNQEG